MKSVVVLSDISSVVLYLIVAYFSSIILKYKFKHDGYIISRQKVGNFSFLQLFLATILPIVIAGFRYNVGTDYPTYLAIFESYNRSFSSLNLLNVFFGTSRDQPGVMIVCYLSHLFNSPVLYFSLFTAIICIPVVCSIANQYKKTDTAFCYFIFLLTAYLSGLNIIKQICASSIVFWGYKYIFERKPLKFFFTIIIASCFHIATLIVAPLYFLWSKKGISGYQKKILFLFLYSAFVLLFSFLAEVIGGYWAGYSFDSGTLNLTFFVSFFWIIIFYSFRPCFIKKDGRYDLFIFMFLLSGILSILGFWSVYAKRIASFFSFPQFVLMAEMTSVCKKTLFIKTLLVFYVIFFFIMSSLFLRQGQIIPYGFRF